jgi:hypothetical protein
MKTMTENKTMIKKLEMADIFQVEKVDNEKRIRRWGFYANQGDGTYAIYRPENPVCNIDELLCIEEDGPGAIDIVKVEEIDAFLNSIGSIRGIPAEEVSALTACGWYYDTII